MPSNSIATLHYMTKKFKTHIFPNFSELVQDIPIYLVLDRTEINELWTQPNPPKILKYIRGKQTRQTSFWSIILWWISLTFKGWRRHLPTLNTIESTTLQISMQILVLFPPQYIYSQRFFLLFIICELNKYYKKINNPSALFCYWMGRVPLRLIFFLS